MGEQSEPVAKLVTTRPEADVAADLKRRLEDALDPVSALIDEAAKAGFLAQWDGFIAGPPPHFRHRPNNLRIVKVY